MPIITVEAKLSVDVTYDMRDDGLEIEVTRNGFSVLDELDEGQLEAIRAHCLRDSERNAI